MFTRSLQPWPWDWSASAWPALPSAAPLQPWPDLLLKLCRRRWAENEVATGKTWPVQLYRPVILLPRKPKVEPCDLLTPVLHLTLQLSWLEGHQRCTEFLPLPREEVASQMIGLISLKGLSDGEPRVCFLITMLPCMLTWLEMPNFFLLNLDLKV